MLAKASALVSHAVDTDTPLPSLEESGASEIVGGKTAAECSDPDTGDCN